MLNLQDFYPSQDGNEEKRTEMLKLIEKMLISIDEMKDTNKVTLGEMKERTDGFYQDILESEKIPEIAGSNEKALDALLELVKGHPYVNQNYFANFLPLPNIPSILGSLLTVLVNGNNLWDVFGPAGAEAEVKIIAMMRKLIGASYANAWGYTTWGGQGAVFTGLRIAITKQFPRSNEEGIPGNLYCFSSDLAHYSLLKSVQAVGIGTNNLIKVRTKSDNSMDVEDLRIKMDDVIKNGGIPIYIVATMGTTDNFGIDDIKEIKAVSKEVSEKYNIKEPHIHADSSLGGFYTFFNDYDFIQNTLNFDNATLIGLNYIHNKISYLSLADSVCFDFHKLGQTPYVSSLFLTKNKEDLVPLDINPEETPYIGNRGYGSYHTGYTFEVSRMASSIAIYASLITLGVEGYQLLLGHYLRINAIFREQLIKNIPNVAVTNEEYLSIITTFRIYPETALWKKEKNGLASKGEVVRYNELNSRLFEEFGKNRARYFFGDTKKAGIVSTIDNKSELMPIYSAKFVPISPYTTEEHIPEIIEYVAETIKSITKEKISV